MENEKNLISSAGFDFDIDTDDKSSKASRDSNSDSEVFENSVEEPSRRNENVNTINENVGTKGSKLRIANDQKVLRRSSRERKRTEFYSASLAKAKYVNNANKNVPNVRKSERKRNGPNVIQTDYADAEIIYVNSAWTDGANYRLKSDEYVVSKNAMNGKFNCLIKNVLCNFVEKPKNVKVKLK